MVPIVYVLHTSVSHLGWTFTICLFSRQAYLNCVATDILHEGSFRKAYVHYLQLDDIDHLNKGLPQEVADLSV